MRAKIKRIIALIWEKETGKKDTDIPPFRNSVYKLWGKLIHLFTAIAYYGHLIFIQTNFTFCLRLFAYLYMLIYFLIVYINPFWPKGFHLLTFTVIVCLYAFIFEFWLYKNSVFSIRGARILLFFSSGFFILFFIYLYFPQPHWCVCIALNIALNFVASTIFRSFISFPNIFSIAIRRYLLPLKLCVFFTNYVIVLLLYLLSFRHVPTIIDVYIRYLNPMISYVLKLFV